MKRAPVDDLTASVCGVCGTDRELTRPNSLLLDGVWHGEIVCTECDEQARFWMNCIYCGDPRHRGPCSR